MTTQLPLRHALALGLIHGPAELLPISSSGHVTLIPWLAGWRYEHLDPQLRKSFEVALHAGTAAGLLLRQTPPELDGAPEARRRLAFLAAAAAPPALAGCALHGHIERRLGTPRTIAAGLIAGSLAMALAELRARRRGASRRAPGADVRDGIALGVAQALALMPGVSRSGATFSAARARGFTALDAERVSLAAGLPVLGGATLLQGAKMLSGGLPAPMRPAFAAGAGGAFVSTLLTPALLDAERRSRAALPACVYRLGLAAVVIKRSLTPNAASGGILGAFKARP
ncbi:MAG: undecaprenyl-diphosphate phosphatase [Solirubrobacteraceae bacterium]